MSILAGTRRGYQPISQGSDLPRVGDSIETSLIDFKSRHTSDRFEAAKDVSALANTSGGTILIGARAAGDLLVAYEPLLLEDAKLAKNDYEQAVRDRCSPAPVFDVSFVPFESGTVVAVNVWPTPGQPVGVELLKKDLQGYEREVQGTYFFPVRVGSHTRAILPEQLPMFIDAKARKTAIILSRAIGGDLVLTAPKHDKRSIWRDHTLKLLDVSVQDNSVVVGIDKYRVSVPLDLIEAAWIDGSRAHIAINGYIDQFDSEGTKSEPAESGGHFFVPLPRFMLPPDAGR